MSRRKRDAKLMAKIGELTLASTTKISTIFFAGIAMTVAGGLVTAVTHSGPAAPDRRFPASVAGSAEAGGPGARIGNRNASASGFSSRAGRDAASAAAAELQRAAEAQQAANAANATQPTPISVTPDPAPAAQRKNPGADVSALASAATSTSTSSSTATGTAAAASPNGYGASVFGSGTDTNTSTAAGVSTGTGPAALVFSTSAQGWGGVCQQVTIKIEDMFGGAAATSGLAIALRSDLGGFYSDAGCASATSSVSAGSGATSATVYFKSSTNAQLTASASGLNDANTTVSIAEASASLAVGQSDVITGTANTGGIGAATLSAPGAVLEVNGKLVVADTANNRVLIWNSAPAASGKAADLVLGQPDMFTSTANTGGTVQATTLSAPNAVASDGTRLFVSDSGNNRVLIWSTFPTSTQAPATYAVGQPGLVTGDSNHGGLGAASLQSPSCVLTYGSQLIVCDRLNNRVLVWTSIPGASGVSASFAVGQAGLGANGSGTSSTTLSAPRDAYVSSGGHLYVGDTGNNRVLAFTTFPSASGAAANFALGQAGLGAGGSGTGASGMSAPSRVRGDSQGRLLVADSSNHRVLVWNQEPSASGVAADGVIGQADFTGSSANQGGVTSATGLDAPGGLDVNGTALWIGDTSNNRVVELTLP